MFLLAFFLLVTWHAFTIKKRRSLEKYICMHCTLWGWEEWIKGETHSGKDISGGKVSLLNLSIQNKIDDKYVGMCVYVAVIHCVPLFYTVWVKAECNISNEHTHKKNI